MSNRLNHLGASPVRGQLEPYDPLTPPGWRYIQTTDTINQFRVLLPPTTSTMYEQLLALEQSELSTPLVAWDRLLAIRHLKDRMIRKCQRLSGAATSKRMGSLDSFIFQTVVAPPDFRLKEMEKWLKTDQNRSGIDIPLQPQNDTTQRRAPCCARCATHPHGSRTHALHHSSSTATLSLPQQRSAIIHHVHTRDSASRALSPPSSPEPLPIPPRTEDSGPELSFTAQPDVSGSSRPQKRALNRRRSCIKRSSSDTVKTVSWFDNHNWVPDIDRREPDIDHHGGGPMSNLVKTTESLLGKDWEEVQAVYNEQIERLSTLGDQVEQSLERLRRETNHLEQVKQDIMDQRGQLDVTFQDLKRTRARYSQLPLVDEPENDLVDELALSTPLPESPRQFEPFI